MRVERVETAHRKITEFPGFFQPGFSFLKGELHTGNPISLANPVISGEKAVMVALGGGDPKAAQPKKTWKDVDTIEIPKNLRNSASAKLGYDIYNSAVKAFKKKYGDIEEGQEKTHKDGTRYSQNGGVLKVVMKRKELKGGEVQETTAELTPEGKFMVLGLEGYLDMEGKFHKPVRSKDVFTPIDGPRWICRWLDYEHIGGVLKVKD